MRKQLQGTKVGMLQIIRATSRRKHGSVVWECVCDCGKTCFKVTEKLNGKTRICGCLKVTTNTTHGELRGRKKAKTRIYEIWSNMRKRCRDMNGAAYKNYGGRGIVVCKRWESFRNFKSDMGNPPSDLHEIERIENGKGYTPGNCRWATIKEQARNKRSNFYITFCGRRRCLAEWCEILGKKYKMVWKRMRYGKQTFEQAIGRAPRRSTPLRNTKVKFRGQTKTVGEWCRILGLKFGTVYARVRSSRWPIHEALSVPVEQRSYSRASQA